MNFLLVTVVSRWRSSCLLCLSVCFYLPPLTQTISGTHLRPYDRPFFALFFLYNQLSAVSDSSTLNLLRICQEHALHCVLIKYCFQIYRVHMRLFLCFINIPTLSYLLYFKVEDFPEYSGIAVLEIIDNYSGDTACIPSVAEDQTTVQRTRLPLMKKPLFGHV